MNLLSPTRLVGLVIVIGISGCQSWFLADADREVYRLIEQRQQAALGETHNAHIGVEAGALSRGDDRYRFVPHPVDSKVPSAFRRRPAPIAAASSASDGTAALPDDPPAHESESGATGAGEQGNPQAIEGEDGAIEEPVVEDEATVKFSLADCLSYALKHSREYQTAKEDLYLTALDLTLERHLWTPQFVSAVSGELADFAQADEFDRAMTAVADVSVFQALPYGGELTAQVIHTLMRDLGEHVTSGETGLAILTANLPLLRGAGRVAYESRYQAERNLIYAVRNFERFRRSFLVDIASDFFALLVGQSQIENAAESEKSFLADLSRAQELVEYERLIRVEADRARVEYLIASNDVITARESYETSLDLYKIRLGMPIITPLEIVVEEIDLVDPGVFEKVAIETALRYRLDLLNDLDSVDDARRGVAIARNNFLPQFDLRGSVTTTTDASHLNAANFSNERTTWRGLAELEIPLDRKRERNDYRSAWIGLRRAERLYDEASDRVRVGVRAALRRLTQAQFTMEVQFENIKINKIRREHARILFELGMLRSNRDKIEAENDYRRARDRYAAAVSDHRVAILVFLRDTGTLRVDDNGRWIGLDDPEVDPPAH